MALSKSIDTRLGVPATYWHIAATDMKWQSGYARLHVDGYADKDAADASGIDPLTTNTYVVRRRDYEFDIDGNVLRQGYEYLKAQEDDFDGATDLFEPGQQDGSQQSGSQQGGQQA